MQKETFGNPIYLPQGGCPPHLHEQLDSEDLTTTTDLNIVDGPSKTLNISKENSPRQDSLSQDQEDEATGTTSFNLPSYPSLYPYPTLLLLLPIPRIIQKSNN